MIRKKQITIIKMRTKVIYKNQILRDEIEKKIFQTKYIYIYSNQKLEDQN